jgi:hypothetical protein
VLDRIIRSACRPRPRNGAVCFKIGSLPAGSSVHRRLCHRPVSNPVGEDLQPVLLSGEYYQPEQSYKTLLLLYEGIGSRSIDGGMCFNNKFVGKSLLNNRESHYLRFLFYRNTESSDFARFIKISRTIIDCLLVNDIHIIYIPVIDLRYLM